MTNKELIKLAYDMGAHPYSVGGMVAALQKGIEIGKEEQKARDDANTIMLIQEQKELSLALIEKQKAIDIEVAVAWLRKYVRPYYKFSIEEFKKAMEE